MQNQEVIKNTVFNRKIITMILAFAAVYLIWGSTYLGIKYAIETIPAFMMAGGRFIIAGSILYFISRFTKDYEKPKFYQWRTSFIVGALLLLVGNGGVVIAQHYIPSSTVALLIATEPLWVVLVGWVLMGGQRPNLKIVLGILVGFVGVSLLISGGGISLGNGNGQLLGVGLIILSTIGWAIGSLYGLKAKAVKSTTQAAAMQMLAGGFLLFVVSLIRGEWSTFNIANVSNVSLTAFAYLVIFGSIIGYTAYSWLLKNVEPSLASTYAYVNPLVAVLLGWGIAGESLTGKMLIGAGIIVSSVVLITSDHKEKEVQKDDEIHHSQTPSGNTKSLSATA